MHIRMAGAVGLVLAGALAGTARADEWDQIAALQRIKASLTPAEPLTVGEVERLLEGQPRERAVHRPGIEVAELEPLGEPPRDRALARAGGPVDGNNHQLRSFIAW